MDSIDKHFVSNKEKTMARADLSLKGSIDCRIEDIVKCLNNSSSYYTTSSCSGRIVIFINTTKDDKKTKGCEWIYTSHDLIDAKVIVKVLEDHCGSATFKFEPFILHVRCKTLADAQELHVLCIEAGFENSGITVGKSRKITLAVRSALSLEVPLSQEGNMLLSSEYIKFIVQKANEKMRENWIRTERFFDLFAKSLIVKTAELVDIRDTAEVQKENCSTEELLKENIA